jgi:hypothetical protein
VLVEELPPLDGVDGLDEGEEDADGFGDDLDVLPDGGTDLLDDATGEGDPVTAEWLEGLPAPAQAAASALDDAEADDTLDVGDEAFDVGEGDWLEAGATDMPDVPDEDPELEEGEPIGADAGEEGPLEEGEGLDEGDLPSLDADDGGEGEDEHFFDALSSEEAPLPWSAHRWDPTPVIANFDVGRVVSLVTTAGGAVALGERLFRVARDGGIVKLAADGLPHQPRAIAASAGALFAMTDRGVYRSDDGGESFAATDQAPDDAGAGEHARVVRALALPRGFELAAIADRAGHDGPTVAIVRALSQGRLYVVEVGEGPSPRASAIVAELAEPELEETDMSQGAPLDRLAAAWDGSGALLWIGGPFGVLALQPSSLVQNG